MYTIKTSLFRNYLTYALKILPCSRTTGLIKAQLQQDSGITCKNVSCLTGANSKMFSYARTIICIVHISNVFARKNAFVNNSDLDKVPSRETDMDYGQFESIVKNGLPKTTEPKNIVIIGAGMAGLSAAYVLRQAGHRVRSITTRQFGFQVTVTLESGNVCPPPGLERRFLGQHNI